MQNRLKDKHDNTVVSTLILIHAFVLPLKVDINKLIFHSVLLGCSEESKIHVMTEIWKKNTQHCNMSVRDLS